MIERTNDGRKRREKGSLPPKEVTERSGGVDATVISFLLDADKQKMDVYV